MIILISPWFIILGQINKTLKIIEIFLHRFFLDDKIAARFMWRRQLYDIIVKQILPIVEINKIFYSCMNGIWCRTCRKVFLANASHHKFYPTTRLSCYDEYIIFVYSNILLLCFNISAFDVKREQIEYEFHVWYVWFPSWAENLSNISR